ncbi:hypothetical protein HRG_013371 [Hirsutella rhossiliensis]
MMETAWAKLADYYELTEDSPVYSAATVLNPSLKWTYMEKTWEDRQESWDNSALILPTECQYMDGSHDTIERVSFEA